VPDVRMPNGTIIKNVPEGVTQSELLSRLEASGYKRDQLLGTPATPAPVATPAPAAVAAAPAITPSQKAYQQQAVAQREAERGFFGRAYDKLMGNEIEAPTAYSPRELAARQKEIRAEQTKLTTAAANFDKLAVRMAKEYQGPNAPDRALGFAQRAQAAREEAAALGREYETITKTGLKAPEAQTTRETIGAVPREFFGGLGAIPGGAVQLLGTGLEAAGFDAKGVTEAGRSMREGVREAVEDVFGAPGEALKYDATSQFLADVGGGVGSIGTFLVPGGAAKVAGVGKGLTGAARAEAVAKAARPFEYGLGTAQGLEQGIRDVEATEARTGKDITPGRELAAYLLNAGLGATEVGVAGRIFERIPVAKRGAALEAVSDVVRRGTAGRVDPTAIGQAIARTLTDIESRAVGRVAVRGAEEALQEGGVQAGTNVIAKGLYDEDRGVFDDTGYAALLGATVGGGVRGGVEVASAIRRGKEEAQTETNFVDSPQVEQEYLRLLTAETQALRDQNPNLTQRQAFNQSVKSAGKLYDTAIANTLFGPEGEADVDTGMDVIGAGGAGIAPDLQPTPTAGGTAIVGGPNTGRLGEPVPSVPILDVGTATGERPLAPITGAQVKATVPIIEQAFEAAAIDFEDSYGVKKLNAEQKKQAARIVLQSPEVDPYDAIGSVLDRGAQLRGEKPATKKAPSTSRTVTTINGKTYVQEGPTTLTPEQMQVERQKIDDAIAGMEDRIKNPQGGITVPLNPFATQPTPTVAETATEEKVAPPAQRTMNDLAGIGAVNPENTNEVLVEGGGIQLTPLADNILKVDSLRAVERGGGRKAMEQLTKVADDNGTELQLSPEPFAAEAGKEMTPTELTEWYRGFGFQEQPDGTMVRPAPTAVPSTITPEAAATPQEILADLESFAVTEAQDRELDPDTFLEGVRDAARGAEPVPDQQILATQGPDALDAYKAGVQFGRDRLAEAQAAPTSAPVEAPPVAAPPGAPPIPPAAPPATGGPGGPAPKKPEVVSNGKPVVLTEAQKRTALAKAKAFREKMNRIQKRIAATNKTDEVLSGQVELAKLVRGDKENLALLKGSLDTLDALRWRVILPTLSTEDIFRIIGDRIPSLNEADRLIRQDITRFETKEYLKLAEQLEQIATFLRKYPKAAQILSDLQFASVAYQVDPSKAANAAEYAAKFDKKTKDLEGKLAAEKDAKKQKSLQTKINNRLKEIESVYDGAITDDGRVGGWKDLGRPEYGANRGKEIFKLIRDSHRRDLEASYNALRSRLMETKEGEALDEALEKLEKQFKPALDQTIYFPAMRFGSYYARVGTGENSIFKMFETETKRNQFVRLMQARGEEISETGNVEDLRNDFQKTAGGPLKGVLDLFEDNPKDMGALRGQVFDLWLQSMSAGDMRKHMAPRKMRAGYSTDILKNFSSFRRSSINSAKRAQFGYKLENAIGSAKASVEQQPDEPKLQAFIEEIRLRALNDLTPPSRDDTFLRKAISLGNKAAFYQYLANPKTALIQLTQLHIVALPMLSQKYGTVEATMALSKYGFSSLGGLVASPLTATKRSGDGGGFMGFTFNWEQPNLLENPASTLKKDSDPELYEVLSEGWQEGLDLNLYMDTFANDIGGYGMLDPNQRNALQELAAGRPVTAALRGAVFTFEAMGALMHQMERTNREATYMAALELAYRENKKKGQTHAEAKKNAIEAAVETTLAATFDFSAYNKPRILTSDVGRLAGQFMTYPYMMSSLLVRNLYTAIKFGPLEPGERLAAAQTAAGALINIGLYAGLTGLPLYGLAKVIGSMLAWLFDDDDEEGGLSYIDAEGNIKATYDIDWWFRNVFIPRHFGADGTVANLFGLDDATAGTLARAVEKGPISAITDIDLANSVALDFMFFLPEAPRTEKPEQQVTETVFNTLTGAAGGVAMDYLKAGKDAMDGYTLRALEKMPKLYGNVAKAMRFSEEGQRTYQGELLGMDKDFWTSDKAILMSLGFNSTEAGQRQKQYYDAKKLEKGITAERNKVLSQWRKFIVDVELKGYTPELQAERDRVLEERNAYNRKFPTNPIGTDTLFETQTNALEKMRSSNVTRGVPIDEKSPYLKDILVRRLNAEEAEE